MSHSEMIALCIALFAHKGQKDKGGKPYILHCLRVRRIARKIAKKPLRVMLGNSAPRSNRRLYKHIGVLALLHDAVEDCPAGQIDNIENMIEDLLGGKTLSDISIITRRINEDYSEYIRRIKSSGCSSVIIVKLADLIDHIRRSKYISDSLTFRYIVATSVLLGES